MINVDDYTGLPLPRRSKSDKYIQFEIKQESRKSHLRGGKMCCVHVLFL